MVCIKNKITGPSPTRTHDTTPINYTTRSTHPSAHPPPTTYPPTNPLTQQYNSSGAVRTDQSTTAAHSSTAVRTTAVHLGGTPGPGWNLHFRTILHVSWGIASRPPPSTPHPPPTHRPTHHSCSMTALEQYAPTNLQWQHSSSAVRTTAVRQQELDGVCTFSRFPPSGGGREPLPTKHPPLTTRPGTNPSPQQYESSGAVHTDQSTTAAQPYGSTHHSRTPG